MATLIRNRKKNSVIVTLPGGHEPLMFFPLGDRNGADAVLVEDDVSKSVAVQNAIRQGLIELVNADDVNEVLDDIDSRLASGHEMSAQATATIERVQNRDLVAQTCIGPGAREGLTCGATLIRSQAVLSGDAPPLCSSHESLSGQYFQTEVEVEPNPDDPTGPITKQVWKRVEVTRPQRNLA